MAEAFFNAMAENAIAESAGLKPAEKVDEIAIKVMKEVGIDISNKKPKIITPEMNEEFDFIITMGCVNGCPLTPKEKTIEWNIPDPKGKSIEDYRKVRKEIKRKVKKLIEDIK